MEIFKLLDEINYDKPYPIEGAGDAFITVITNMDLDQEDRYMLLYLYHSAILESAAMSAANISAGISGGDEDGYRKILMDEYTKSIIEERRKQKEDKSCKKRKFIVVK